ncbi:hypothetical protein RFI_09750 [Reticulomyxa filosa]|uniref:alpha-galactosidase n=1 Tax=Reticulomyxa filosa TaxID=46433 RepID=X6NNY4_RETFI|nr:hypothetical protein RFI_09750 [Reticulomyxa filosa]|eukprot:ETO27384.1 hypothetical protein RFI_09750 [Reticulomyxa filosa]
MKFANSGSPLIVATDVRNMTQIMYTILLNTEIISVNQEFTHPAGDILASENCENGVPNACQVWTRQLSDSSLAVVFYNSGDLEHTYSIDFDKLRPNTWDSNTVVAVRDLWAHKNLGNFVGSFTATVPSHGNVFTIQSQIHTHYHFHKENFLTEFPSSTYFFEKLSFFRFKTCISSLPKKKMKKVKKGAQIVFRKNFYSMIYQKRKRLKKYKRFCVFIKKQIKTCDKNSMSKINWNFEKSAVIQQNLFYKKKEKTSSSSFSFSYNKDYFF